MHTISKHALALLIAFFVAVPGAVMLDSDSGQAHAQLRESRKPGVRQHKQAGKRTTTTTTTRTTTTTHKGTKVRNVRPNRPTHPSHHHRRPVTHAPRRTHTTVVHHHHHRPPRSRVHVRYHRTHRHVVHHHHVTAPRVVVVEVNRPRFGTLDCPSRTYARQSNFEQWCATTRGVRHGPFLRYHPDGHLAVEGEYEYGEKHGLWTEWHSNGEPRAEGEYIDGERVGTWVRWDRNGNETSIVNYD